MDTAATLTELNPGDLMPLLRDSNKGLMVSWINHQLLERANHDVRRSIVFYDDLKMFEAAILPEQLPEGAERDELFARLYEAGVRYWSKGV